MKVIEVVGQDGQKLIINKKDFDKSKHELFGIKKEEVIVEDKPKKKKKKKTYKLEDK